MLKVLKSKIREFEIDRYDVLEFLLDTIVGIAGGIGFGALLVYMLTH